MEVERRATLDAVEQFRRYLELLNRDPCWHHLGAFSQLRALRYRLGHLSNIAASAVWCLITTNYAGYPATL